MIRTIMVRNVLSGQHDLVTVETAFSEDAEFWTKEGWYACLNSFDLDVKTYSGKTEADAIRNLCDYHDYEPSQQLTMLV